MHADRPAETFFLFHRARRMFFLMSQKENGGRIAGWQPSQIPRPMGRTHTQAQFGALKTPLKGIGKELHLWKQKN